MQVQTCRGTACSDDSSGGWSGLAGEERQPESGEGLTGLSAKPQAGQSDMAIAMAAAVAAEASGDGSGSGSGGEGGVGGIGGGGKSGNSGEVQPAPTRVDRCLDGRPPEGWGDSNSTGRPSAI